MDCLANSLSSCGSSDYLRRQRWFNRRGVLWSLGQNTMLSLAGSTCLLACVRVCEAWPGGKGFAAPQHSIQGHLTIRLAPVLEQSLTEYSLRQE